MGWEVSFLLLLWRVLDVVAAPVEEGGPTLPLWGRVVTYDDGMRSGRRYAGWRGEAVEAMAFAARSTGVVMEATGAVVAVTES